MATPVKLVAIGNSTGVILPKEALAHLNLENGDTLYLRETPAGLQLSPYAEEFGARMEVGYHMVRRYRDALKKLTE